MHMYSNDSAPGVPTPSVPLINKRDGRERKDIWGMYVGTEVRMSVSLFVFLFCSHCIETLVASCHYFSIIHLLHLFTESHFKEE